MSVVTRTSEPGRNLIAAQSSPIPRATRAPTFDRSRIQAISPNSPRGSSPAIFRLQGQGQPMLDLEEGHPQAADDGDHRHEVARTPEHPKQADDPLGEVSEEPPLGH